MVKYMLKYLLILFFLMSATVAYEDLILDVYSPDWIETANYEFVHVNNTQLDKDDIGKIINITEISQLGNKSVFANIAL
jgi:hypothetical protein